MGIERPLLQVFVVLHAAGAAFSMAGFLFFPEAVVDLVPDTVPLRDVRHMLALFAVLPATFIAWDIVLLAGLRASNRYALVVGFISGSAGVLGAILHSIFDAWPYAAADGTMGLTYLALTAWNWRRWPTPRG